MILIHQAFVSPTEAGGTRHYEFARHLVGQKHQVSIVASNLSYLTGKRNTERSGIVIRELLDGIQLYRARTFSSLHRSFVWRVVSFFSFMLTSIVAALRVRDVDVVMGTSPPIFQAASAWVVSALKSRPFLLEIRDLWPEFAIDMGVLKNPALIWLSRRLERFLYGQADHMLVNSPAYRDYLLRKGIPERKITLIPNGVDPGMFDPAKDGSSIRHEFNLNGKFVVTYAGALGPANDLLTVLKAADILRGDEKVHFLLVGDGKDRVTLENAAKELNLPNITFTGTRPKTEMVSFLAASDACLAILKNIPMFKTTYPNKVFDYMAAGRPTILAIDGVIRKVIEESGGGIFVQPGNPKEIAGEVSELSSDAKRAQKMGLKARAYVEQHFNRQIHAQAFSELLLNLVGSRVKPMCSPRMISPEI